MGNRIDYNKIGEIRDRQTKKNYFFDLNVI